MGRRRQPVRSAERPVHALHAEEQRHGRRPRLRRPRRSRRPRLDRHVPEGAAASRSGHGHVQRADPAREGQAEPDSHHHRARGRQASPRHRRKRHVPVRSEHREAAGLRHRQGRRQRQVRPGHRRVLSGHRLDRHLERPRSPRSRHGQVRALHRGGRAARHGGERPRLDASGQLWISGDRGIARFNPATKKAEDLHRRRRPAGQRVQLRRVLQGTRRRDLLRRRQGLQPARAGAHQREHARPAHRAHRLPAVQQARRHRREGLAARAEHHGRQEAGAASRSERLHDRVRGARLRRAREEPVRLQARRARRRLERGGHEARRPRTPTSPPATTSSA